MTRRHVTSDQRLFLRAVPCFQLTLARNCFREGSEFLGVYELNGMPKRGVPWAESAIVPIDARCHKRNAACPERAARRRVEWCGRGDSNPYDIAIASPSSWCVCQFRHFRIRGNLESSGHIGWFVCSSGQ